MVSAALVGQVIQSYRLRKGMSQEVLSGLAGLDRTTSQFFAVLTDLRSVGVMGDERTYDYAIALRAVTTTDFMTAEVTILPTETITTAANRIVNEVKNINRVMFDYTTKPPATIEFE